MEQFTFLVKFTSLLTTLRGKFIGLLRGMNCAFAKLLGFPENAGMPAGPPEEWGWRQEDPDYAYRIYRLENHQVPFPPRGDVYTLYDVFFRPLPKVATISKYFYESDETGYYSFYLEHFRNSLFLPDWFSEFLQIQLGFCLDLARIEGIKQGLFFGLIFYLALIYFRSILFWFVELNPYTGLLYFPCAMVDWFEELCGGYIPNVYGVNMSLTILNLAVGKLADYLNHLSFTMPYLPSEGVKEKIILDGEAKYVLNFRYLPYLWYKHPIPNDIRQYWILERPEILNYMQKSYGRLDIDLLPDAALKYADDNPDLNIQSTLFNSLPSNVAEQLKTLSFIGSHLDVELPDADLDIDLDLDLMDFFHYIKDLF